MSKVNLGNIIPKTIKIERFDEDGNIVDVKEVKLIKESENKYIIKEVD